MAILNGIRKVLEKTEPDIVADIMSKGIHLTGGSAKLNNFAAFLEKAIKTKIHVAEDPFHTAVKGAMIALEKPSILENTDYLYRSIQELKIDYSE